MGDLGGEGILLPPTFAEALFSTHFIAVAQKKLRTFFMKKIGLHIKHIVPWVVALLIFVYLFHAYPPSQVFKSLTYVNLWYFTAFALAYFFFIYLVDAWTMTYVLNHFSYPVSFKDVFLARGVTYLIMIINYPASQAAFAYYLKRRYRIPISEVLSIFIFIVFIDLCWIITLALAGSFFQDYTIGSADLGHIVRVCAVGAYIFVLLWLAFWRRWPEKIIGRRLRFDFIERLRKKRALRIFEQATAWDYLRVSILRIPIHFTIIISMYVLLMTFNVSIPFTKILGNVPLVFFIGTLPITPGGLGTTNAAMVELLHRYLSSPIFETGSITPQELLLAATLLWMLANYILKVLTGTFYLKRVSRHLFQPVAGEAEEKVEKEASHVGGNI